MTRAATLLTFLFFASRASAQAKWMLAIEGGYGPRFERVELPDNPGSQFSTQQVAHAGTIGFALSRFVGDDAYLLASARAPLIVHGEWTVGLGAGYEKSVARSVRLGGVATFGYGGFTANACDCGRLVYTGIFLRAHLTFRYRFLERSPREPRSFDVFLSTAVGATAMQSHYPHVDQVDETFEHTGLRLGPDATVGIGLEF